MEKDLFSELSTLPIAPQLLFATRCCQRARSVLDLLWPSLNKGLVKQFDRIIRLSQAAAQINVLIEIEKGEMYERRLSDLAGNWEELLDSLRPPQSTIAKLISWTGYLARSFVDIECATIWSMPDEQEEADLAVLEIAAECADAIARFLQADERRATQALQRDARLIIEYSKDKQIKWGQPIVEPFYALRAEFNTAVQLSSKRNPSLEATDDLLASLARDPGALYTLKPDAFEAVVARLLGSQGYEVQLTRRTKDRGVDIIAISSRDRHEKLLIECKRYSSSKRIGISVVDRLLGALMAERGVKALVVTTAEGFTRDAEDRFAQTDWRIGGRAYSALV